MCDECLKTVNSGDKSFIEWSRVFVYTPIKPLLEARKQNSTKKLTEEYIGKDKDIYITSSPYEIKNRLINSSSFVGFRILYDDNIGCYIMGNADKYIHGDLCNAALEAGYYSKEYQKEMKMTHGTDYYIYDKADDGSLLLIAFDKNHFKEKDFAYDNFTSKYEYSFGNIYLKDYGYTQNINQYALGHALGNYKARWKISIDDNEDLQAVEIKENYVGVNENLLLEANRQQLISKSKHGDDYQDTSKGRNRYERRTKSHIATTVAQYNKIDMNTFFKEDILNVMINVMGETDNYLVKIKFGGVLAEIAKEVKSHNNTLDFGVILRSLLVVFNSDDVYVSCSCPDFRYRFAYVATKNNYNSGEPETRVADITNPRDSKGAACKHVLNVLANLDWVMKVASVINNYIKYAKEYMQKNFADFIFPKIFGMPYNKAIQLGLFDTDDFDTSQQAIDIANKIGRTSGQYQTGKETPGQMKFTKKSVVDNPNQLKLDLH